MPKIKTTKSDFNMDMRKWLHTTLLSPYFGPFVTGPEKGKSPDSPFQDLASDQQLRGMIRHFTIP